MERFARLLPRVQFLDTAALRQKAHDLSNDSDGG
jgi:hypothetical protein